MLEISFLDNVENVSEKMEIAQTQINEVMNVEYLNQLRQLQEVKKQLEVIEKEQKAKIYAICEANNIKSIKNSDEGYSIAVIAPTEKKTFNADKAKETLSAIGEDIEDYYTTSISSGYARITFK